MNVDREQQKEILQILFDEYPWSSNESQQKILRMFREEPARTTGNLLYLQRHNLIENAITVQPGLRPEDFPEEEDEPETLGGAGVLKDVGRHGPAELGWPVLTEKGIDFLLGDDGLSSILNIRRVRIEESSLKLLSTTLLDLAAASKKDRKPLLDKIMEAPIDGLNDYISETIKDELSSAEIAKKIAGFLLKAGCSILPF